MSKRPTVPSGPPPTPEARAMMNLFEGYKEAYGTYDATVLNDMKGGKLEIKASAATLRKPVTPELWQRHLSGEHPVGIIPVRDNDTCLWGAIDVDSYNVDHVALVKKCAAEELPLVVCRSKSGGAHLFLFMAQPVKAALLQMRLKEMSALLGCGASEVFPKQRSVQYERGDMGSWLNMPYFGGDETERYGYRADGTHMTVAEFLEYAEARQQPGIWLQHAEEKTQEKRNGVPPGTGPDWADGPPCLQHLAARGVPDGVRNNTMYAMAIFAKKKYTDWHEMVDSWNSAHFKPPLTTTEMLDLRERVGKKDYNYPCKSNPLESHCNSALCRTRRFGVGGEGEYPDIGGLSYLDADPPLWFLDIVDERLELTTDELMNYHQFQKVCMERMRILYRSMKQSDWHSVVGEALKDVNRIEASVEVGLVGHFMEILEDFVINRYVGKSREEVILGKPWLDEAAERPEDHRHYFRLKDLQKFCDQANFKIYSRGQIVSRLRRLGGGPEFWNIKGQGVNVWWIPRQFKPIPSVALPPLQREPI